jgi:hypothetical protein
MHIGSEASGTYYLIVLNSDWQTVYVQAFPERRRDAANRAYGEAERRAQVGEKIDAVLVIGGRVATLKKAFPNFFLDTHVFVNHVKQLIASMGSEEPHNP